MIIYNITCVVETEILEDWLIWIEKVHIPEILETKFFFEASINKVISVDDSDCTYAISYSCESIKKLHEYQVKYSKKLQRKHSNRYGEKVLTFRTILETIKKFN